jgi:hypothetical protein
MRLQGRDDQLTAAPLGKIRRHRRRLFIVAARSFETMRRPGERGISQRRHRLAPRVMIC